MFSFKACPRCTGDLYHDRDKYGTYTSCIQCGHYLSETEEARLMLAALGTPAMYAAPDRDRIAA